MAKGRKATITPQIIDKIVYAIENGSFDHVAASAVGISRSTFYDWLRKGQKDDAEPLYVELYEQVTQAKGKARNIAENRIWREDPYKWLRYGPGRERPDEPGWTSESSLVVAPGDGKIKLTWADDQLLEDNEAEADAIDA